MRMPFKKLNQAGFDHVMIVVVFVVLFALVGTYLLIQSHAATSNVTLHMTSTNGPCIAGTTIQHCSGSPAQTWGKLTGSNFQIKNGLNQCLDDWNGKIHTSPKDQNGYIHVSTCYGNANQKWNWAGGELRNVASGGCLNAQGASANPGTALIVYACNGKANEIWKEVAAGSSTGGGSGGGSSSGEQAALCREFGYSGQRCSNVGVALNELNSSYRSWANTTQEVCLGKLWNQESGWDNLIWNSSSGAFGIAQALGHGGTGTGATITVDLVGGGHRANTYVNQYPSYVANKGAALYQIIWGLNYIKGAWGTPCGAWSQEVGHGWYVETRSPSGATIHS